MELLIKVNRILQKMTLKYEVIYALYNFKIQLLVKIFQ